MMNPINLGVAQNKSLQFQHSHFVFKPGFYDLTRNDATHLRN